MREQTEVAIEYSLLAGKAAMYMDAGVVYFCLHSKNEQAITQIQYNLKLLGYTTELDKLCGIYTLQVSF
jgi:hypothetical protein